MKNLILLTLLAAGCVHGADAKKPDPLKPPEYHGLRLDLPPERNYCLVYREDGTALVDVSPTCAALRQLQGAKK